jgi:uncharacterized membrane protein
MVIAITHAARRKFRLIQEGEIKAMKKIITTFMMMALMAVAIPMFATSAEAQNRRYRTRRAPVTTVYKRPNFYQRHRNVINIGIGTAAGALLGGLIGGKKGALIGTAAGAGGAALYTYKLNPKTRRYERVYNRRY